MKTNFKKRWYLFIPLFLIAVAVFTYITMWLWNSLLPDLFHFQLITFWQALGLLVLGRLLFGGFGGNRGRHGLHWRNHMREKWEHMTPEEREKFRQNFHGHPYSCYGNTEEKASL